MKRFSISTELHTNGFHIKVNSKKHTVVYPEEVWNSFPAVIRLSFAECITFITTLHFTFNQKTHIDYEFPNPVGESFFYHGLLLGMSENILDFEQKKLTVTHYLKLLHNSFYQTHFEGKTRPLHQVSYKIRPGLALVPFTFGKDSLLTYAVCREIGIKPIPFFFLESSNRRENYYKEKLISNFKKEFHDDIHTFTVPLASFKHSQGFWWGWDIFLTQYTLFLIPYLFHFRPEYLFWSNEYECNEVITENQGFFINETFEQSARWMGVLNTGLRMFGSSTKLGSIIEPLSRLSILYTLHNRYPLYGKYQTSCLLDGYSTSNERWCGKCYECAQVYLYLRGLNIDPHIVGFTRSMFEKKSSKSYASLHNPDSLESKYTFRKEERLLAASLVKERIPSIFKKEIQRWSNYKKKKLLRKYFSLFSFDSVPEELKVPLKEIYTQELANAQKNYIRSANS